ncbi:indole-3-acetic acid-induced protein ARG7-like [Impatiens glandulifera]|uniref:indole-3-acetic acid-induced protein ARG7-like n=1 Tax=Impatiens glandulifera TaxID=253017 RepID=UPI001FB0A9F5|nr:indole-3-acetic acid-induced protein ARG7-like [Impatiens glandulifera]
MVGRWRKKAAESRRTSVPVDVPSGHVAIYVGSGRRRFVVRAEYLNHPLFVKLLDQAKEEYGFSHHGPLALPCDEPVFEETLRFVSLPESWNPVQFVILDTPQDTAMSSIS